MYNTDLHHGNNPLKHGKWTVCHECINTCSTGLISRQSWTYTGRIRQMTNRDLGPQLDACSQIFTDQHSGATGHSGVRQLRAVQLQQHSQGFEGQSETTDCKAMARYQSVVWEAYIGSSERVQWMNEWCIYIALYCVLLYTQSALQSCGGGSLCNHHQCAASTWMMRRTPQDNGASALRRESHRANQVDHVPTNTLCTLVQEEEVLHNYTEYNQQWNVLSAFNPSTCTHTWSSGQLMLRRPGSSRGSVPCSRVSPQFLLEPRFKPTTSGYKSNALSIRATTAPTRILHVAGTLKPIVLKLNTGCKQRWWLVVLTRQEWPLQFWQSSGESYLL